LSDGCGRVSQALLVPRREKPPAVLYAELARYAVTVAAPEQPSRHRKVDRKNRCRVRPAEGASGRTPPTEPLTLGHAARPQSRRTQGAEHTASLGSLPAERRRREVLRLSFTRGVTSVDRLDGVPLAGRDLGLAAGPRGFQAAPLLRFGEVA
jgi:hypothetical protein